MKIGAVFHSSKNVDFKRFLSILGGAVLFAIVGFGLILLFFVWIPSLVMIWDDQHPQAVAALLSRIQGPQIWIFLILFSAIMPMLGVITGTLIARKQRSDSKPAIPRFPNAFKIGAFRPLKPKIVRPARPVF